MTAPVLTPKFQSDVTAYNLHNYLGRWERRDEAHDEFWEIHCLATSAATGGSALYEAQWGPYGRAPSSSRRSPKPMDEKKALAKIREKVGKGYEFVGQNYWTPSGARAVKPAAETDDWWEELQNA